MFTKHFVDQVEDALSPFANKGPKYINDYPAEVFLPAKVLKSIYASTRDADSYEALCGRFIVSPKDCEHIATLHRHIRRYTLALEWVEKGLQLEETRDWRNETSYSLSRMRQEFLAKTGHKEEALEHAWSEYKKCPSLLGYAELMKLAPQKDRKGWHEKTLEEARKATLDEYIRICMKTKELDVLSQHIDSVGDEELENISSSQVFFVLYASGSFC